VISVEYFDNHLNAIVCSFDTLEITLGFSYSGLSLILYVSVNDYSKIDFSFDTVKNGYLEKY
jgi:hypothetical protein